MPMKIIFIIIGALCILGAALIALMIKKQREKMEENSDDIQEAYAQDFVNTLDIDNEGLLYTADGHIITYIRVHSISLDLLSLNEKRALSKRITEELSGFDGGWKFLAISRPVDIQPLISEFSEMMSDTSNVIRRKLLRNAMRQMNSYAITGEVMERQFYFCLWEEVKNKNAIELLKKAKRDMIQKLITAGVKADELNKQNSIRLINLINNPSVTAFEDSVIELDTTYPIIE